MEICKGCGENLIDDNDILVCENKDCELSKPSEMSGFDLIDHLEKRMLLEQQMNDYDY